MKTRSKKEKASPPSRISDARFASFETDPRFRLPSKKRTKTTLDKRFSGMLEDDEFTATAKVDRYGRKVQSDSKKKALQRLYQAEDGEEQDEDDAEDKDSEDEDEEEDDDEDDDDEEDAGKNDRSKKKVDADELLQSQLRAAHENSAKKKYDPARQGGFDSSSDSDSDEEDDDDDDENQGAAVKFKGDLQRFQEEQEQIETGEVTRRIAIVNLDWDHVTSTDLFALFSSFITSNSGSIVKVSIYPSEFGKERMRQEDIEGPPKDLFQKNPSSDSSDSESDSDDDEESDDEQIKKELMQEADDEDFDSDALRAYQLDRLRYYYAVMECSNTETAQQIYETTDGTEYQSSSNVIDLRFIPDDVTFDDEPRDECDKVPESYKPIEFVTKALQSSKVKLTWDMHPEEATRKESIKRAFTGSRADIGENDLRAYLASDSEEEESGSGGEAEEKGEGGAKLSKRELARKKMREALGLGDEEEAATKSSTGGAVGEMQITFAPALTDDKPKQDGQEETTIEKYKRKEKEKKEKKRQAAKAKRGTAKEDDTAEAAGGEDLGFDDPFFTTEEATAVSKTSIRKEERRKKREAREAAEAIAKEDKARLSKVMADGRDADGVDHLEHFDMSEIVRAEKKKNKKAKGKAKQSDKKRGDKEQSGLQKDFEMDVRDDRFTAVFDSHEYAIDPSNPKFKATGGMKKLLEEGRKKRKAHGEADEGGGGGGGGRPKAKRGKR